MRLSRAGAPGGPQGTGSRQEVGAAPWRPAGPLLSREGWVACAEAPLRPKHNETPQQPRPCSPDGRASHTRPDWHRDPTTVTTDRTGRHRISGQARQADSTSGRGTHDFPDDAGCAAGTRPLRVLSSSEDGVARPGRWGAAREMDCPSSCPRDDAWEPGPAGQPPWQPVQGWLLPSENTGRRGLTHVRERLAFRS